ncbi:MAG TPA: PIG-L deacetylase family protein [Candidatus Dormibacteraeota bacterium]
MARRRLFSGPADRRIKAALCIVAHPDDIDFFCAGTVILMAGRGVSVDFVLATSGDKGTREAAISGAELAARREREQLASARLLGAGRVEFLGRRDAELVESLELRGELVREIRRSRPDVILTFDPTPGYRQHPDHRVVGRVALDAAWPCARDPLSFPEAGPPHEAAEAWLFGSPPAASPPDLMVDVRDALELKIAARLEHASQTYSPARLRARWRRTAAEERFVQVDLR